MVFICYFFIFLTHILKYINIEIWIHLMTSLFVMFQYPCRHMTDRTLFFNNLILYLITLMYQYPQISMSRHFQLQTAVYLQELWKISSSPKWSHTRHTLSHWISGHFGLQSSNPPTRLHKAASCFVQSIVSNMFRKKNISTGDRRLSEFINAYA